MYGKGKEPMKQGGKEVDPEILAHRRNKGVSIGAQQQRAQEEGVGDTRQNKRTRTETRATQSPAKRAKTAPVKKKTPPTKKGTKKKKAPKEKTTTAPVVPPAEDNDGIIFKRATDQKERYQSLVKRKFKATRYMDDNTMAELGIKDDVYTLLKNIEILDFAKEDRPTYRRITLEVLSSCHLLTVQDPENPGQENTIFYFRCFNEDQLITIEDFCKAFKVPCQGGGEVPGDYNDELFWKQIGTLPPSKIKKPLPGQPQDANYRAKDCKASHVINPVFKYALKIIANSILGRGDSTGVVNRQDNYFLNCMVYKKPINSGLFLARQMEKFGNSTKGDICVGGLISLLIERMNINIGESPIYLGSEKLDIANCISAQWLKRAGNHFHVLFDNVPMIKLPNPHITTHTVEANWKVHDTPILYDVTTPRTSTTIPPPSSSTEPPTTVPEPSPERVIPTTNEDKNYLLLVEIMKKVETVMKQNETMTQKMVDIEERQENLKNTNMELHLALTRIQKKLKITPSGSSDEEDESESGSDSDSSGDDDNERREPLGRQDLSTHVDFEEEESEENEQQQADIGTIGEGSAASEVERSEKEVRVEETAPETVLQGNEVMKDVPDTMTEEVAKEHETTSQEARIDDAEVQRAQEPTPMVTTETPQQPPATVEEEVVTPDVVIPEKATVEAVAAPAKEAAQSSDVQKKKKKTAATRKTPESFLNKPLTSMPTKVAFGGPKDSGSSSPKKMVKVCATHPSRRTIPLVEESSSEESKEKSPIDDQDSASNKERARIAQKEKEKEENSDYAPSG